MLIEKLVDESEFKILKEEHLSQPAIFDLMSVLLTQYHAGKREFTRADVTKALGGEYLKDILNEMHYSGDMMKGIDSLAYDFLLYLGSYAQSKFELKNDEICPYLNETCTKTEKNKASYKGRKLDSCNKKEYTTDCKKIILKFIS